MPRPRRPAPRSLPAPAEDSSTAYLIRLHRGMVAGARVVVWLTRLAPLRWGERDAALRFLSESEAWRAASAIRIRGAWTVEKG